MNTNSTKTSVVGETLSKPDIHDDWESDYRNVENEKFYEIAFAHVAGLLEGQTVLDIGCGSGAHAMRLAGHGFHVTAADFSPPVVENATRNVAAAGYADKVEVIRANVLDLSIEDEKFDNVMCWGVLMHIPEVEKALDEMCRVLRPGGRLITSETNPFSLHSQLLRTARRLLNKPSGDAQWTSAGIETWANSSAGSFLTRQMNPSWFGDQMTRRGLTVERRFAGEFTELYTKFSSPLVKQIIHAFNRLWFNVARLPQPSLGNIFIAKKSM